MLQLLLSILMIEFGVSGNPRTGTTHSIFNATVNRSASNETVYSIETEESDEKFSVLFQYSDDFHDDHFDTDRDYKDHRDVLNDRYLNLGTELVQRFEGLNYTSIYASQYAPFIEITYDSVASYEEDIALFELLDLLESENEHVVYDTRIQSDEATRNNTSAIYDYEQALQDVGIQSDEQYTGDGIKIGSIEKGIPEYTEHLENVSYYCYGNYQTAHCSMVSNIFGGANGIASNAEIYFASAMDYEYIACVDWLVSNNVDIINQSFSMTCEGKYTAYSAFVDYIVYHYGITFVAATGNLSMHGDNYYISDIAMGENVISVAANDSNLGIAWDSRGQCSGSSQSMAKPTLSAPGGPFEDAPNQDDIGGTGTNGTSYSTAFVSGIVALLMEEFPVLKRNPQMVMSLLTESTAQANNQKAKHDPDAGFGIVNYEQARNLFLNTCSFSQEAPIKSKSEIYSVKSIDIEFNSTFSCVTDLLTPSQQYSLNDLMISYLYPEMTMYLCDTNTGEQVARSENISNLSSLNFKNETYKTANPCKTFALYINLSSEWDSPENISGSITYQINQGTSIKENSDGMKIEGTTLVDFTEYDGFDGTVIVPDSVTEIKSSAFSECEALKRVVFTAKSQLKTIGAYAFSGCENLESVIIPKTVDTISWAIFLSSPKVTAYTSLPRAKAGWDDAWNVCNVDYDNMLKDYSNGIIRDDQYYYEYSDVVYNF